MVFRIHAVDPPAGPSGGEPGRPRRAEDSGESVMIIDIDQSAAIRARHGSAAGEQLGQAVAECLRRRLRTGDRLALLREDEFLAVLPGAPCEELPAIEARLREGVRSMRLSIAGKEWQLSCTIGSACSNQLSGQSRRLESLVRLADAALHRARASGGEGSR
jgi:diguanylate cyclase (GGDEF)-like protein